jgi:hypothetical protein
VTSKLGRRSQEPGNFGWFHVKTRSDFSTTDLGGVRAVPAPAAMTISETARCGGKIGSCVTRSRTHSVLEVEQMLCNYAGNLPNGTPKKKKNFHKKTSGTVCRKTSSVFVARRLRSSPTSENCHSLFASPHHFARLAKPDSHVSHPVRRSSPALQQLNESRVHYVLYHAGGRETASRCGPPS